MKYLLAFLICVLVNLKVFAQNGSVLSAFYGINDIVEIPENFIKHYRYDTTLVSLFLENKTLKIFNNKELIDSLKVKEGWYLENIEANPLRKGIWFDIRNENDNNHSHHFLYKNGEGFEKIFDSQRFKDEEIFSYLDDVFLVGFYMQNYRYIDRKPYVPELFVFDSKSGSYKKLISVITDSVEAKGIVDVLSNNSNYLLKVAVLSSDHIHLNSEYFLLEPNLNFSRATDLNFEFRYITNDISNEYTFVVTNKFETEEIDGQTFAKKTTLVLGKEFAIVGKVLNKSFSSFSFIRGFNYRNDKLYSYNVITEIDLPEPYKHQTFQKRLIGYRAFLPLEVSFYKIYQGEDLLMEDLDMLNVSDLHLLKNFVFAKHNYQFDSEYYQGYFNLFDFYKKGRGKRIKDLNNLLSIVDLQNLQLINSFINKMN